ncbi:Gfo/Idh/MocA family oxidoreductase [Nonomuraea sp. MCN248]|uniref:Gfo/Idh/MocA family oxidoreductase n=1 Tax=Nonomuraea corallina TaxID=2989783 RepID=A0ABT4S4Z7_9ACTN|nr:Gfo/Idh/MocA family oxidoreductase [Nonomuraea corallina]MDA0632133.1 Gfo/Idh/MocA family oxidoreductase [Nonomuraea corallina]
MTDSVLMVGLGAVARTHLAVLAGLPQVDVIAGVDPSPPEAISFRGHDLPVAATLREVTETPALVVIATPTATHSALCRQARELFPGATILVEKPAADGLAEAVKLLVDGIEVAFHMAYAPEVLWGEQIVRTHELGPVREVHAWFADPYAADLETARERFTSSWIDSGINALSVLARFCDPVDRVSLRRLDELTYEARIRCTSDGDPVEALIMTSWRVTDAARRTRLRFASGAELLLDHHAVAGYLVQNGRVTTNFGTDGSVPRRESHYLGLYRRLLVDRRPLLPNELSILLHNLLLRA